MLRRRQVAVDEFSEFLREPLLIQTETLDGIAYLPEVIPFHVQPDAVTVREPAVCDPACRGEPGKKYRGDGRSIKHRDQKTQDWYRRRRCHARKRSRAPRRGLASA